MKWLVVQAPALKIAHERWMALRGVQLMPEMTQHAVYVAELDQGLDASLVIDVDRFGLMRIMGLGAQTAKLFPTLDEGAALRPQSSFERGALLSPLRWVIQYGEADCRRLTKPPGGNDLASMAHAGGAQPGMLLSLLARAQSFELLLLPFGDPQGRVGRVHAIIAMDGSRREGQSRAA